MSEPAAPSLPPPSPDRPTVDTPEPAPYASRAGEKLAAALRTFQLQKLIRGRVALDVGASHGGFTDCLLRLGAARVTAVDVGYGQMREPLRSDARIELMERTNFKTLSLRIAPGPFGFFVVDVSFASARSMLRAIAMRVEPGTPGVVLVKPQFELPKVLVPDGGVIESKNLRKLAFNRFKKKARERGFRVVARMDSPVAGGSGNVEILAYLIFDGMPAEADTGPETDLETAEGAEERADGTVGRQPGGVTIVHPPVLHPPVPNLSAAKPADPKPAPANKRHTKRGGRPGRAERARKKAHEERVKGLEPNEAHASSAQSEPAEAAESGPRPRVLPGTPPPPPLWRRKRGKPTHVKGARPSKG